MNGSWAFKVRIPSVWAQILDLKARYPGPIRHCATVHAFSGSGQ